MKRNIWMIIAIINYSILYYYPEAKLFNGRDIDDKCYVYYANIDLLYKKKYYVFLIGRGDNFVEAYKDFCEKALNPNYLIRYKNKFYATNKIRGVIKRSRILDV